MADTKRGAAAWLVVVVLLGAVSLFAAFLITDTSGANLELAPVFVCVALAVLALKLVRHRSGSGRP